MGSLLTPYSDSLLGLSYLVVTTDMFFFTLKQKAATERPFEVWVGSLGLGRGTAKKHCLTAQ